jgi:organic radical activating enzyme
MHINIQPIEKYSDLDDGATLHVHSIFHTIQGEGPLTGHPAIFIRLAGCNLQCPQCDTIYTDIPNKQPENHKRQILAVEAIVARVRKLHIGPRLVVITGGEPFRQNISPLCYALLDEDYRVQIETNGTLHPPPFFPASTDSYLGKPGAWIVVSPKAGKVNSATASLAIAWKYVLNWDSFDPEDGLPILALGHTASPRVARPPVGFPTEAIYVQPTDTKDLYSNEKNIRAVIRTCMKNGYTLQLQLHKILNLE